MKTHKIIFTLLLSFFILTTNLVKAESQSFFLGAGGQIGLDVSQLKGLGGGTYLNFGYNITDRFSVMGQTELYYTQENFTNHFSFPILALAKYKFYKSFFVKGGFGVDLTVAEDGTHFTRYLRQSRFYAGFSGDVSLGYEHDLSETVYFGTELGVNYSRIAGINRIRPKLFAGLGFKF